MNWRIELPFRDILRLLLGREVTIGNVTIGRGPTRKAAAPIDVSESELPASTGENWSLPGDVPSLRAKTSRIKP